MTTVQKYMKMKKEAFHHYWAQRILSQVGYMIKIFETKQKMLPDMITQVVEELYESFNEQGTIEKAIAIQSEEKLKIYSKMAKEYRVVCAAHAHIDMNWMWGMQETVSVVIDTFQTMLNLMDEYPEFKFSQSQASTYKIIDEYCPSMLPAIKQRVKEGRWEVTASSWVELDKNMSGTEAMARHLLYSKKYLSKLLDITEESIELDFEPDTFGHSAVVPEILQQGGVKYYYHCRGFDDESIYRWKAQSGASVLVYREPVWYNGAIEYDMMLGVPEYCTDNHTDIMMKVYGVGDHGGGPTRRDIERIMDMATWPIMPQINFGTMHEFFHELEKNIDQFPVIDRELNFAFTGCYTSQGRIKMANRLGEDRLYDGETLSAFASIQEKSGAYSKRFDKAWEKILFNQFHDILPGSGVVETREYAMGLFQEALSYSVANANRAMKVIGDAIDTSALAGETDFQSISEGAGVGYNITKTSKKMGLSQSHNFGFSHTHRGNGDTRIYTMFNTTQYDREDVTDITIWDWKYETDEIIVIDSKGNEVEFEIIEKDAHYWLHHFTRIAVLTKVPAFGFSTYCVKRRALTKETVAVYPDPRVHKMEDGTVVMENENIKAVFATDTMKLVSLTDKQSNQELVKSNNTSGYFRYIEEEDVNGMSAWIVGGYSKVIDLNETSFVRITDKHLSGTRQWIEYDMKFMSSNIKVKISLDQKSTTLRYTTTVDWHEIGKRGEVTPQLQFFVPFSYKADQYRYDIPAGYVDRDEKGHDVPAIMYAAAIPNVGGSTLMLTTDCKYGYRAKDQSLTVNLLRSSYEPDPYPEFGVHSMDIGIVVCENADWTKLLQKAIQFSHPIYPYSNSVHGGTYALEHSFLKVSDNVKVSTVKIDEAKEDSLIVRMYHCSEQQEEVVVTTAASVESAKMIDILENEIEDVKVDGDSIKLQIPAYSLRTLKVKEK